MAGITLSRDGGWCWAFTLTKRTCLAVWLKAELPTWVTLPLSTCYCFCHRRRCCRRGGTPPTSSLAEHSLAASTLISALVLGGGDFQGGKARLFFWARHRMFFYTCFSIFAHPDMSVQARTQFCTGIMEAIERAYWHACMSWAGTRVISILHGWYGFCDMAIDAFCWGRGVGRWWHWINVMRSHCVLVWRYKERERERWRERNSKER